MNEITRIHIAKVPYNIEPLAKKQLGNYLESLRQYVDDDSVVEDIEIRITEILGERGITADGTIEAKDVMAIIGQLGEPSEFYDDKAETAAAKVKTGRRKLLRDPEGAWLGGVLQGMAEYSGVSVWVFRALVVALAIGSFGTAILLYILLWIVIPPVRTPADRLQLLGEPVTAAAIKQMGTIPPNRDAAYAKGARVVLGSVLAIALLGIIAGTSLVAYKYNSVANYYGFRSLRHAPGYVLTYWHWALGAFVAAGAFAGALLGTVAYLLFSGRVARRAVYGVIIMVVLMVAALVSSIGLVRLQQNRYGDYLQQHLVAKTLPIPVNSDIRALRIEAAGTNVSYIVRPGAPQADYRFENIGGNHSLPTLTYNDSVLTLQFKQSNPDGLQQIDVSGPALQTITVDKGYLDYTTTNQDKLDVSLSASASMSVDSGNIHTLHARAADTAQLNAAGASIDSVSLELGPAAQANLGNIHDLTTTFPTSCGADQEASLRAFRVAQPTISVNGQAVPATDHQILCGNILLSADDSSIPAPTIPQRY